MNTRLYFILSFGMMYCLLAEANPLERPNTTKPNLVAKLQGSHSVLQGSQDQWQKRAQSWFKKSDAKSRRKQMRGLTRTLKANCYTCHTRGLKGYVDDIYLISLQMMALSGEFKVECQECHIGAKGLSKLGALSYVMWEYSVDQQTECSECHVKDSSKSPFKGLNSKGKTIKTTMAKTFTPYLKRLNFSPELQQILLKSWALSSLPSRTSNP